MPERGPVAGVGILHAPGVGEGLLGAVDPGIAGLLEAAREGIERRVADAVCEVVLCEGLELHVVVTAVGRHVVPDSEIVVSGIVQQSGRRGVSLIWGWR